MKIALTLLLALLGLLGICLGLAMGWLDLHVGGFLKTIPEPIRKMAIESEPKAAKMMAIMARAKALRLAGIVAGGLFLVSASIAAPGNGWRVAVVVAIVVELGVLKFMESKATPLLKNQIDEAMKSAAHPAMQRQLQEQGEGQPLGNRAARRKAKKR